MNLASSLFMPSLLTELLNISTTFVSFQKRLPFSTNDIFFEQ